MATILVVDDEAIFRRVTRAMLEYLGHRVIEVTDPRQAGPAYDAARPDMVIVDMIMPDQDGVETMRRLFERDPQVRVLAVSGGGLIRAEVYLLCARRLRSCQQLAKPFTVEELAAAVDRTLSSASDSRPEPLPEQIPASD